MIESDIKRDIIAWLRAMGAYARVIQVKGIKGRKSPTKGVSDIIAVWLGRFVAIEVKTPTGRISPEQQDFLDEVTRAGGLSIVATCVEDVGRAFARELGPGKTGALSETLSTQSK